MTDTVFNDNDYNSNDGMMTSIWGPLLWTSMHTISFNYPIKPTKIQQKQYYNFFLSLMYVIPCSTCRINFKKNLKVLPLSKNVMQNRESLSRWVYELHELINNNLGKISNLSYENVRDRYEHFRARCLNNNKKDETGCTESLYGVKSKCILNIVPQNLKIDTFIVNKKCKISKKKIK